MSRLLLAWEDPNWVLVEVVVVADAAVVAAAEVVEADYQPVAVA